MPKCRPDKIIIKSKCLKTFKKIHKKWLKPFKTKKNWGFCFNEVCKGFFLQLLTLALKQKHKV